MEAVGKYDFNATASDELSFRRGEQLKVISFGYEDNDEWYQAEIMHSDQKRAGLIPKNYIELKPHPWYHGKIKRKEAEKFLNDPCVPNGGFIVRESESSPGDHSLSVKCDGVVQHFKILKDDQGKYFLWVVKFASINSLIEYHRTNTISRTQDTKLRDLDGVSTSAVSFHYERLHP